MPRDDETPFERYARVDEHRIVESTKERYIADIQAYPEETDWAQEREDVLSVFAMMLAKATGDGSKKRQAGTKPPWYRDPSHEAAIFSHLNKWKHGERRDADSGAHPLVHLAWRALAIAYQETYGHLSPRDNLVRPGSASRLSEVASAVSSQPGAEGIGEALAELRAAEEKVSRALLQFYH